jgi:Tfp pilus assembly protein PilF
LIVRKTLLVLAAVVAAASCAPADIPPPAVTPQGDDQYLVDPRSGYEAPIAPAVATRFDTAWRWVVAGTEAEAERRLAEILTRDPEFLPARLAQAVLDIRAGRLGEARDVVASTLQRMPRYTAARVYEAEIEYRENRTRLAYDLYRELAAGPDAPPFAAARVAELQSRLFNDLFASARAASGPEAVRLLREALTLDPSSVDARILLARNLLGQRQFDEARRELDPILDTAAERAEVQELLGEIEVGRGRYQEAIVRFERLARSTRDPRFERRLEEIKLEWSAANMPSHFRTALESVALTRAELATLMYWTVPAVRFAQNLATPPIALDVEGIDGREEVIRAMAIGLFDVDPVTRRVSPSRPISAARLAAHLSRLLTLRGAACARGIPADRVLSTCGVPDPLVGHAAEDPVTGREAAALLAEIAKKL